MQTQRNWPQFRNFSLAINNSKTNSEVWRLPLRKMAHTRSLTPTISGAAAGLSSSVCRSILLSCATRLLVCLLTFFGLSFQPAFAQLDYPRPTEPSGWLRSIWGAPGVMRIAPVDRGRAVSQTPHPAIVRVIVPEKNSVALGSGTLVLKTAGYGIVLTNWHVVREAKQGAVIVFPDGSQLQGQVLRMDEDWDLAVVKIPVPAADPLPISASAPRPGEILWIAGYGSSEFLLQMGRCTQYLAPRKQWPLELVEVAATARQGDSGGPILNQRGELAGVLFGQGDGFTSGSFGGRVLKFLETIPAPDFPQRVSLAAVLLQERQESQRNAISSNSNTQNTLQLLAGQHGTADRYWNSTRAIETSMPTSLQSLANGEAKVGTPLIAAAPPHQKVTEQFVGNAQLQGNKGNFVAVAQSAKLQTPPTDPTVLLSLKSSSTLAAPTAPTSSPHELSWQELAGTAWWDQAKTVLALLGLLAVGWKLCGWLTRG